MRSSQTSKQKSAAVAEAEQIMADRAKDDPIIPDYRLPRPCNRCGFMRRVLIRIERIPTYLDGVVDRYGQRRPIFKNGDEQYEAHCTACKYDLNARKYERLADENTKRARDERSRQALRRLQPYKRRSTK